ncbi:uncharacterized protein [Haliotis asinina]|uniref:uncharacterized protein n=1 Tax=Haliotis asinina TaxID=109174 RepID=UPI003531E8F7
MLLLSVVLTTMLQASLACNPFFCTGRAEGEYFCDPADSASYYRCVFNKPFHFTCGPGTVYDGSICNWPDQACIKNPVPDPVTGEVVGGICVPTAASIDTTVAIATTQTSGSTVNTETTVAIGTTQTTRSAGNTETTVAMGTTQTTESVVIRNIYRRHPNMRSGCTITQESRVVTPMSCGSKCSITGGCTGFNLSQSPGNTVDGKRYECRLLTCLNDHMLSAIAGQHFYDKI